MELTLFNDSLTPKQQEAVSLHYEIKRSGEAAAAALVEFARGLKQMRDSKLYEELGYDSFDGYAEDAVGIRQRQAYNYISALESLGEAVLQSNATLGITKLSILAALPVPDRDKVLEENDVESMSVRELKELKDKLTQAEEQLTLFREAEDESTEEISQLEAEVAKLRRELKAEQEKPTPTVIKDMTEDEKKALVASEVSRAVEAEKRKFDAELKAAKESAAQTAKEEAKKAAKAKEDALNKAEEGFRKALAESDAEKKAALERLAKMEGEAKVSASPEIVKFSFYFEECQKFVAQMKQIISGAPEEQQCKLRNACKALANMIGGI